MPLNESGQDAHADVRLGVDEQQHLRAAVPRIEHATDEPVGADHRHVRRDPGLLALVEGDRPVEVAGRPVDDARGDTRDVGEHRQVEQALERLVLLERGFGVALFVLELVDPLGADSRFSAFSDPPSVTPSNQSPTGLATAFDRALDRRHDGVRRPPDGAERAGCRRAGCRA